MDDYRRSLKKLWVSIKVGTSNTKHHILVSDYATKVAKEALSKCSKMIDHIHNNLLNLAQGYVCVAFVLTTIADLHTYRAELFGYLTNFNLFKNI